MKINVNVVTLTINIIALIITGVGLLYVKNTQNIFDYFLGYFSLFVCLLSVVFLVKEIKVLNS